MALRREISGVQAGPSTRGLRARSMRPPLLPVGKVRCVKERLRLADLLLCCHQAPCERRRGLTLAVGPGQVERRRASGVAQRRISRIQMPRHAPGLPGHCQDRRCAGGRQLGVRVRTRRQQGLHRAMLVGKGGSNQGGRAFGAAAVGIHTQPSNAPQGLPPGRSPVLQSTAALRRLSWT